MENWVLLFGEHGLTGWPRRGGHPPAPHIFLGHVYHKNTDLQEAADPVSFWPWAWVSCPNPWPLQGSFSYPTFPFACSTCPQHLGALRTQSRTLEGSVCTCTWFALTMSSQCASLYHPHGCDTGWQGAWLPTGGLCFRGWETSRIGVQAAKPQPCPISPFLLFLTEFLCRPWKHLPLECMFTCYLLSVLLRRRDAPWG